MTIPIKQIKLHKLNMTMKNPFMTSFGTLKVRDFFIIDISDGEGHYGYGESVAFNSPWYTEETVASNFHMMDEFLIPLLKENRIEHPDDVSTIFAPIRRNNMAKSALEGAVWDLYAKRNNQTLAIALGGELKSIDVGVSIGIKPSVDELIQEIEESLQAGFKRIKIKIKPGWDIDILWQVRMRFPDIPIMADANSAYTLDDVEHLKQLDQFNLMMIEQPLGHDDIVDHAKLQKVLATPICLDESITSLEDARKAVELGSCKVINLKIGRVGGLTESKRIHDYCKEQGIDVWCGGMLEAGVGRAHNIALTTLSQFTLPGDTAGSARYWEKDIIKPEVVSNQGVIEVPEKAGIGYEIDWEAMDQFTQWTKVYHL